MLMADSRMKYDPMKDLLKTVLLQRIDFSKYIFMLMMILWSAKTTDLLAIDPDNTVMAIVYITIIIFYYYRYCRRGCKRPLYVILGVFALWYGAICIKYGSVQKIYFGILINTIIAYIAFNLFKRYDFFVYAEKVLVHLCILSLIIWSGYVIMPSLIGEIMDAISVSDNDSTMRANIFLVGIGNQVVDGIAIKRNIGFTWEAGRFSCFLVFAMFLNLSLHNMSFSWIKNRSFYILLIGLASTLSTTGIVAFSSIVLYYVCNKSAVYRGVVIAAACLLIPVVWGLSFMGDKFVSLIDYEQEIHDMQWMFDRGTESITPQRITGAYLELQNFFHDFWLGYNINENAYATNKLFDGNNVWLANGIIQIFSMYGFFVGFFFYLLLFNSSVLIVRIFNKKGVIIFALMFILLNVSYEFWTSSVFLYCIYYSLFNHYMPYGITSLEKV